MNETEQDENARLEIQGKALGFEGRAKLYRMVDVVNVLILVMVSVQSWAIINHMEDTRSWTRAMVMAIREQSCLQRFDLGERAKHIPDCQQEARIP